MKLKVLGTQSPYATKDHNCPGFLISENSNKIMLDCGSGTHRLLNLPEDLQNLSVVISHLHRDHYSDIFNLMYSSYVFHNQNRLETPIEILLPRTPKSIYDDIISEENSFVRCHYIDEIADYYDYKMCVSFLKTDHPIETYAIKVDGMKNSIVYTSDTSFSSKDKLVEFSKNSDLLICESSLLTSYGFDEICNHLTAKQAAIIAKQANVHQLMLTHFWPEEDTNNYLNEALEIFPNTIIAKEGLVIDLSI